MIEVTLGENDSIEWALKTFKRKMVRSGILRDLRKYRYYVKPGEARNLKSAEAARRRRKAKRKQEM